ncbi:MAG: TolC family protein [Acidobacteriota bacterium]
MQKAIQYNKSNRKLNLFFSFPVIFFFSIILVTNLYSIEKNMFSLSDVQNYALKNSRRLINAKIDMKIAKKKVWETTASGLPQLDGSISYSDMTQIPTTLIPARFIDPDAEEGTYFPMKFGTQHNVSMELIATQLIFNGTYIVALQSTKIYMKLSEQNLLKSEKEVKALVTGTYYLVLISENLLEILNNNYKNLKKLHYETSELVKAGFLEDTDADQIEFSMTALGNKISSLKRQIEINYKLLKFQMGLPLDDKIILNESLDFHANALEDKLILSKEFDHKLHIDFRMSETNVKSLSLLLKKEKSMYLPTLTAFMSHKQSSMRDKFNFFSRSEDKWFPSTIIGFNMNIPIFSSGMRSAIVKQSKFELEKAKNDHLEITDGLKLGYLKVRSSFITTIGQRDNTKKNVLIARRIYTKTMEKFKEGISSSIELIQTYNQYLKSESDHTSALIEMFNASIEIKKYLNII